MPKVIETNICINDLNAFIDHQSRVIEIVSWESFVNEIKNAETVIRQSVLGHLEGNTIPRGAIVENLVVKENSLTCDVYTYDNKKIIKLVYLINE